VSANRPVLASLNTFFTKGLDERCFVYLKQFAERRLTWENFYYVEVFVCIMAKLRESSHF